MRLACSYTVYVAQVCQCCQSFLALILCYIITIYFCFLEINDGDTNANRKFRTISQHSRRGGRVAGTLNFHRSLLRYFELKQLESSVFDYRLITISITWCHPASLLRLSARPLPSASRQYLKTCTITNLFQLYPNEFARCRHCFWSRHTPHAEATPRPLHSQVKAPFTQFELKIDWFQRLVGEDLTKQSAIEQII